MNRKCLFALWGGLFILCAGLGFIPEPSGAVQVLLTAVSLLFFVPPAVLIFRGEGQDRRLVRSLSACSLGLSAVLLAVNFLTAFGSEVLGNVLHVVLVIVSAPMMACGSWALSLFLWACLLMGSLKK